VEAGWAQEVRGTFVKVLNGSGERKLGVKRLRAKFYIITKIVKYCKLIKAFERSRGREELYVHSVFAKLHHSFMPNA